MSGIQRKSPLTLFGGLTLAGSLGASNFWPEAARALRLDSVAMPNVGSKIIKNSSASESRCSLKPADETAGKYWKLRSLFPFGDLQLSLVRFEEIRSQLCKLEVFGQEKYLYLEYLLSQLVVAMLSKPECLSALEVFLFSVMKDVGNIMRLRDMAWEDIPDGFQRMCGDIFDGRPPEQLQKLKADSTKLTGRNNEQTLLISYAILFVLCLRKVMLDKIELQQLDHETFECIQKLSSDLTTNEDADVQKMLRNFPPALPPSDTGGTASASEDVDAPAPGTGETPQ